MSADDTGAENRETPTSAPPPPARAPRSRKSSKARIHPVDDPDAWRDAVLPDPDPDPAPARQDTEDLA